jgi:hypothetical protein
MLHPYIKRGVTAAHEKKKSMGKQIMTKFKAGKVQAYKILKQM